MATKKKTTIDDYADRWNAPFVSDWNPPKQGKKTVKKSKPATKKKGK